MAGLTNLGRSGTGDFEADFVTPVTGLTYVSYKAQVLGFEPTTTKEAIRITTLATEPYGSSDEGEQNCVIALTYKIMKGAGSLAPKVMANPFFINTKATYDTGCLITGQFNYTTATPPRRAGSPVQVGSAVLVSQGSFSLTWDNT